MVDLLATAEDHTLFEAAKICGLGASRFYYQEARWNSRHYIEEKKGEGLWSLDWLVSRTWADQETATDANKIASIMARKWGIRSVSEMIDGEHTSENAARASKMRLLLRAGGNGAGTDMTDANK